MTRAQQELGTWIMKQKPKDQIVDTNEYDVVVCDHEGICQSITVWRKVNSDRAIRLQEREQRGYSADNVVCIVLSGKAVIGQLLGKEYLLNI